MDLDDRSIVRSRYTQHCAKAPPAGLGHCPLMRSKVDLAAEFSLARASGASGIIVWGSSSDVSLVPCLSCDAPFDGDFTCSPILYWVSLFLGTM